MSKCAFIKDFLNCVTLTGVLRATRIADCLMVSSVFRNTLQNPPRWFPTRASSTQDAPTRTGQLGDMCLVHEELEQQPDVVFVSDFLHKRCSCNFWLCAYFLRRETITPRGSEWPSSTCKRDTMVLAVSRSSSLATSRVDDEHLPEGLDILLTLL